LRRGRKIAARSRDAKIMLSDVWTRAGQGGGGGGERYNTARIRASKVSRGRNRFSIYPSPRQCLDFSTLFMVHSCGSTADPRSPFACGIVLREFRVSGCGGFSAGLSRRSEMNDVQSLRETEAETRRRLDLSIQQLRFAGDATRPRRQSAVGSNAVAFDSALPPTLSYRRRRETRRDAEDSRGLIRNNGLLVRKDKPSVGRSKSSSDKRKGARRGWGRGRGRGRERALVIGDVAGLSTMPSGRSAAPFFPAVTNIPRVRVASARGTNR